MLTCAAVAESFWGTLPDWLAAGAGMLAAAASIASVIVVVMLAKRDAAREARIEVERANRASEAHQHLVERLAETINGVRVAAIALFQHVHEGREAYGEANADLAASVNAFLVEVRRGRSMIAGLRPAFTHEPGLLQQLLRLELLLADVPEDLRARGLDELEQRSKRLGYELEMMLAMVLG